jgi:CHAT domain-containing protein
VRIVASGRLSEIAWAALVDPLYPGENLGERHSIEVRLDASDALDRSTTEPLKVAGIRALVVGDPAFNPDLEAGFARLPHAAEEARFVAEAIPGSVLLIGADARLSAVVAAARSSDLLHVAAHATGDTVHPLAARLLLSPDSGESDGSLTAEFILGLDLNSVRLVVLSSCDSGRGYSSRSAGQLSLARAFLASGAERVLALLRPVDDRLAAHFVRSFYRKLFETGDAGEALARAQDEARLGGNAELASREVWSAFQLYARSPNDAGQEAEELVRLKVTNQEEEP